MKHVPSAFRAGFVYSVALLTVSMAGCAPSDEHLGSTGAGGTAGHGGAQGQACKTSLDCGGLGVCGPEGACVDCVTVADCPDNLSCLGYRCRERCDSDRDCTSSGLLCDKDGGYCVECLSHAECEPGRHCASGSCVTDVCSAGTSKCEGGAVIPCREAGDGYGAPSPCGNRQSCLEDQGHAGCADWRCTAGAIECQGNQVVTCSADGLAVMSVVSCGAEQRCLDGTCRERSCVPSELFCSGDAVHRCADGGFGSTLVRSCDPGQYCDVASVTCETGLCAPNLPACDGNAARKCNGNGSGYLPGGTDCGSDLCSQGVCKTPICGAEEKSCRSEDVYECAADRLSWALEQDCASGYYCDARSPQCKEWVCTPGQATCDGNTAKKCNGTGSGYVSAGTDCGSEVCEAGVCKACTPGARQCAGSTPQWCDGSAHWQSEATCPKTCADGACVGCADEVAAGDNHTCARKANGTLWCWGRNNDGQVGDGSTTSRSTPRQVTALGAGVAEVSGGGFHTCARKADGTLSCWGENANGELGDGTTRSRSMPGLVAALGASVAEVAAGYNHTCARKTDGTLWCWGQNKYGQLGDGTITDRLAPVQVTALGSNVAEVATGSWFTCARKTDGSLWCWGDNAFGQLGDGTDHNARRTPVQVTAVGANVAEVATGDSYACARKTDGTLWCWGVGSDGELGDGTDDSRPTPGQVTALGASVAQVSAGHDHACARKTDGTLWCWGKNVYGELGDGTTRRSLAPIQVTGLGDSVAEVATGDGHTCARGRDGAVWCWGQNTTGQLGDGTVAAQSTPVQAVLVCP